MQVNPGRPPASMGVFSRSSHWFVFLKNESVKLGSENQVQFN